MENNFNFYSRFVIQSIIKRNPSISLNAAYNMVNGLEEDQCVGIHYGLSREEVMSYTFSKASEFRKTFCSISMLDAFNIFDRLNPFQHIGIRLGLTIEQVTDPLKSIVKISTDTASNIFSSCCFRRRVANSRVETENAEPTIS